MLKSWWIGIDDERADFIKAYFHADWPNRSVYHGMFNTGLGDTAGGVCS
jgi:hypothetical protein